MRRISSPFAVVLLFAGGMAIFGSWIGFRFLYYPVWLVISGKLFQPRPIMTGGALDQTNLTKMLFISAVCMIWSGLVILLARFFTAKTKRAAHNTFRICSILVYVTPLTGLSCTLYEILRYMCAMGYTQRRLTGVLVCIGVYMAVAVFLYWTCRFRLPFRTMRSKNIEAERKHTPNTSFHSESARSEPE